MARLSSKGGLSRDTVRELQYRGQPQCKQCACSTNRGLKTGSWMQVDKERINREREEGFEAPTDEPQPYNHLPSVVLLPFWLPKQLTLRGTDSTRPLCNGWVSDRRKSKNARQKTE